MLAGDANPVQLKCWIQAWLERIRSLYADCDELMAAWQDSAAPAPRDKAAAAARLDTAYAAWDDALAVIDEARKDQVKAPGLQEPAKKALAALDREWDGLAARRDYPMTGLDSDKAGRTIRGPVVTRKNARGSGNGGSAGNAAVIWAVTGNHQPPRSAVRMPGELPGLLIDPGVAGAGCDTRGVVRDLRPLRLFAVLRDGRGGCCPGFGGF